MQALSADHGLLRSLRERRWIGFVHSAFEHVVNVEGDDGGWFSVASRSIDDAPDTLIVDVPGFGATGIARGDRVEADGRSIFIRQCAAIRLDGARQWHAALPAYPADESQLRANLVIARTRIGALATGTSSFRTSSGFAAAMTTELQRRATMLCAALTRRDLVAACIHGKSMIGLGPGLTPTGDDFLLGLFAALHLPGSPCGELKRVCVDIVANLPGRTNAISAAALRAAARGRVRECIQLLLHELVAGSPQRVPAALERVLAIGSTSGADIAAGIVAGFELGLRN